MQSQWFAWSSICKLYSVYVNAENHSKSEHKSSDALFFPTSWGIRFQSLNCEVTDFKTHLSIIFGFQLMKNFTNCLSWTCRDLRSDVANPIAISSILKIFLKDKCLFGFLTSSSTTRLYCKACLHGKTTKKSQKLLFLFTFLQLPLAASMILGLNYVRSDSRVVI